MSIYQKFCEETVDANGALTAFRLHYPENFNFGYDVVDAIAEEAPEKRALVWCSADGAERTFTFAELRALSNRAANVFLDAGIGRGDRVIVSLKRHYEYWPVVVALHKIGAVTIPVTHMLTAEDFRYRIESADVKAIVCTPQDEVPEKVRAAVASLREDAARAKCGAEDGGAAIRLWTVQRDAEGFENLTACIRDAAVSLERRETAADDPMLLYFTSGTTGNPKGVIHDFTYPLAHIVTAKYWQQAEEDGLHFTVAETGWGKASWGKIYGQWLVGSAVMAYDFDHFDPKQLVGVINRYGVTSFCAPPTVYRYLVRKGFPDMPTLRHAATAGEMLAPEVFRKFTERTGILLCEGYGQTETTLLLANFKGNAPVDGSLGTVSPQYRVELQRKDGTPAAPGEIGEIVVVPREGEKPVGIFTGYLNDGGREEAARSEGRNGYGRSDGRKEDGRGDGKDKGSQSNGQEGGRYRYVWRNGVYHTGDAAWRDDTGRFWFHSRFDDIIKTSGYRIGPYEIERVLAQHPCVAECSVVGVPDKARGQAIKAFVVPAKRRMPTMQLANEIKNACNEKLAEYKWIRSIEFVRELPKTISGKVRHAELRKRAEIG